MSFELDKSIISEGDFMQLMAELRSYAAYLHQASIMKRAAASKHPLSPELSPSAELMVKQSKATTGRQVEELIEQLADQASAWPRVRITLAALAPTSLKRSITEWVRQEINPQALIDFRYSQELLGGMVVQLGSRIFDWSFRQKVLENRDSLVEVLRRV